MVIKFAFSILTSTDFTITVESLLSDHLLKGHPYKPASNQSPDDSFSIFFKSIKRPASFKRPLFISPRVAV